MGFKEIDGFTAHQGASSNCNQIDGCDDGWFPMSKKAKELAPITVSRLTSPGLHFVGGVAGLALQVLPTGGRTWILRATVGRKRRDMGLGGYPDVTLSGARESRRVKKLKLRKGGSFPTFLVLDGCCTTSLPWTLE
jgi:hypothetical protein